MSKISRPSAFNSIFGPLTTRPTKITWVNAYARRNGQITYGRVYSSKRHAEVYAGTGAEGRVSRRGLAYRIKVILK